METKFQNTKNWKKFQILISFYSKAVYEWYLQGLNEPSLIYKCHEWNKLKMFISFVSVATELSDRQRIYKNTIISKQIILLVHTEIWIMYTHSVQSPSI